MFGSAEEEASGFQKTIAVLGEATMGAVNAMLVMQTIGMNPLGKGRGLVKE